VRGHREVNVKSLFAIINPGWCW